MPIKFTEEEVQFIREYGKKLVDANKIEAVKPCLKHANGDLVRIKTEYGCVPAICATYSGNCDPCYITQGGTIYPHRCVEVLEIIGKCVFSVYV